MKKMGMQLLCGMFAAALLLSGCSSSQSGQSGSGSGGEGVGNTQGEQVELIMYSWRPEDKKAYEKFIAAFEKENPTIKVTFKPFKSTEYNTILTNTLTSGTGADIVQLRPYQGTKTMADAGYLVPLDDVKGVSDIQQAYLDAARGSDGNVYGVPLFLNNGVIFYNKQVFEENNVQVPQTWDEFLDVSKQLQSKGIVPVAQSGKAAYLLSMTHSVIGTTAYGGNDFVEKALKGEVNLKDPAFIQSIQRMADMESFFPKDFIGIDDKDAQALFLTGKAAMYINGSHRLQTFEKNNPDLPLDVIPTFAAEKGGTTPMTTWVDGSFGVVKSSKHQEEAKKFMEFLASKEFGQMYSDELNRVSAISGVVPKHPLVKKMTELTEKSNTPYLMLVHFGDGTPTTKTTFENALQGMYIDQLTVEQVADEAQKSADKWFTPQK
ncbi:extracellular solute-binding protein [Brevibacillus humidisoli]|uniref:ABC transporter substrate-binding protein n=1 Tax=Brevibacillus humidisoli TaxID=2895522 RepID=UPI001E3F7A9F|nr:extracellular solute-binding protein [Brevibacillus humidisoli]UFJ41386.1 extracellular solute-binding protein [Brevibacillus humidisoli]